MTKEKKTEQGNGAFTPTGKPWKSLPWQITPGLDKFGNKKIQIKLYRQKKRGFNFSKYQAIYAGPIDWKELKKEIKKTR